MRLILISLVLVLFVFKAHSTPESQHKLEAINTQYSSLKQRIESLERQDLLKESKYENLHTKLTELKIVTGHLHLEKGNSEYSKAALNQLRLELSGLNNRLDILRDKAVNVGNDSSGIGIASLVLGASGLIITGVSLGIAIFAFWGYRNIKKEASELAAEKSKEMVENKIEIGEFDQVIYKAVEKAIYRDILSTEDFPEDEGVNDESL